MKKAMVGALLFVIAKAKINVPMPWKKWPFVEEVKSIGKNCLVSKTDDRTVNLKCEHSFCVFLIEPFFLDAAGD